MLAIQMNVFRKELEKAIQLNYASVTFIHGIGKGVLKDAIQQELSTYKGIKHYPANFQRYGNGATKVEII
jgi:dsDNA-specific endonuclease/ATPase MutS2